MLPPVQGVSGFHMAQCEGFWELEMGLESYMGMSALRQDMKLCELSGRTEYPSWHKGLKLWCDSDGCWCQKLE